MSLLDILLRRQIMDKHIAIVIGGIVMYFTKSFLGEGKLNTLISIVVGIIVAFILYFYI